MQSACTIGGDANDMQEHCRTDAFVRSEGFQGWQDSELRAAKVSKD